MIRCTYCGNRFSRQPEGSCPTCGARDFAPAPLVEHIDISTTPAATAWLLSGPYGCRVVWPDQVAVLAPLVERRLLALRRRDHIPIGMVRSAIDQILRSLDLRS